jgi:hypothetical protein
VSKILKQGINFSIKPRSGRPKATTSRMDRTIFRLASTQRFSSSQIKLQSGAEVTTKTIRNRLKSNKYFKYQKMKVKPPLSEKHITSRLEFAKRVMSWDDKWMQVVFSDEKKFNLDGPDGLAYYWHDLRKEERSFMSRASGGGSVMVWAGFGFNDRTPILFMSGRQDSLKYQNVLESSLLPYGERIGGPGWIFQQDNCSIHVSKSTKAWFGTKKLNILEWPSRSPDLNPIENLWGTLVRLVYANGRQFVSLEDLRKAIVDCWYQIDQTELQNLVLSMKTRIFNLIIKKGKLIKENKYYFLNY